MILEDKESFWKDKDVPEDGGDKKVNTITIPHNTLFVCILAQLKTIQQQRGHHKTWNLQ